jgi:hypothetical protein
MESEWYDTNTSLPLEISHLPNGSSITTRKTTSNPVIKSPSRQQTTPE